MVSAEIPTSYIISRAISQEYRPLEDADRDLSALEINITASYPLSRDKETFIVLPAVPRIE